MPPPSLANLCWNGDLWDTPWSHCAKALVQDWSTIAPPWDELYEDEGNEAPNAWNAAKAKANDQAVGTALAQTANALEPGSEIVLRKNAKGTVK